MKWFRLHSEVRTDAKLRALTHAQRWVFVSLLCYASEQKERGTIRGQSGRLLALEVAEGDTALLEETLAELVELDILEETEGGYRFTHWSERQYEHPSDQPERVRDRVKRHRNKGNGAAAVSVQRETSSNDHETTTVTTTESESDSEQSQIQRERDAPAPAREVSPYLPRKFAVTSEHLAFARGIGFRGSLRDLQLVGDNFLDNLRRNKHNRPLPADMEALEADFRMWVRREVKEFQRPAHFANGTSGAPRTRAPTPAPTVSGKVIVVDYDEDEVQQEEEF